MKQVDYFTFFYRILHPPHTTFLYIYIYIYLEDYMSFHFLILFKIIFVLKKYDIFLVFFNDFNVLI